MKRTSNVQRPTSNVQRNAVWPAILAAMLAFTGQVFAAGFPEVAEAERPLEEGVPQVAVMRLRALLSGDLPAEERRIASAKLGETLLAAGETEEALQVLQDPTLQALPATRYFRAQALATLGRWSEALPLYQQVAAEPSSPFRSRAILGKAEALRALQHPDEALQVFALLFSDPQTKDQAQLRSAPAASWTRRDRPRSRIRKKSVSFKADLRPS
jgi:tetratricopeptide (TPR) repeat protein